LLLARLTFAARVGADGAAALAELLLRTGPLRPVFPDLPVLPVLLSLVAIAPV